MTPTSSTPPTGETPVVSTTDERDAALLARLLAHMQAHSLSKDNLKDRDGLARQMATSETYLYRYLTNDFRGRLDKFEDNLKSFLDGEHLKVEGNSELVATDFIIHSVHSFLRQAKMHGRIGVGHGDAGRGKTCAARLFAAKDKTCIYIHARMWLNNRHHIVRELENATGIKTGKRESLDEALVRRLTNSDRLIIIDNAQRLTESARRWLADFWDLARCPIALIGNPEIEKQWQRNDQHGSRVGLHRDITLDLEDTKIAKATAAHLIRLHLPEASACTDVITQAAADLTAFGSCRAVVMRAKLAANMLQGGKITNPAQAFSHAKTQLINAA